jgi:hypothetical protein
MIAKTTPPIAVPTPRNVVSIKPKARVRGISSPALGLTGGSLPSELLNFSTMNLPSRDNMAPMGSSEIAC